MSELHNIKQDPNDSCVDHIRKIVCIMYEL